LSYKKEINRSESVGDRFMGKNGDILGSKTQPNFYKFAKSKKANLRLSLQSAVSSKNSE